jgi:hypothetical protein
MSTAFWSAGGAQTTPAAAQSAQVYSDGWNHEAGFKAILILLSQSGLSRGGTLAFWSYWAPFLRCTAFRPMGKGQHSSLPSLAFTEMVPGQMECMSKFLSTAYLGNEMT